MNVAAAPPLVLKLSQPGTDVQIVIVIDGVRQPEERPISGPLLLFLDLPKV